MDGTKLKEKLLALRVPFNEIADRLGVTAQSLNSCFKVKDVRSNTIERIAEVLGVPMSFFYPEDSDNSAVVSGTGNVAVAGNNNVTSNAGDTGVLQERVRMLEKLLDEKERTIKILMEK